MICVSSEVAEALAAKRPVVALETTLITHGLPRPSGLEVAAEIERTVRAAGAIPAIVGALDGRLRVGLSPEELARLAAPNHAVKVNPGNLAAVVASGAAGSVTVAATLLVAARVGIEVVATGGIGGVHRGAHDTGDISADLAALARFPVAVVCAGAKAVLDLPRTVEALESLGVPIYGVATDEFPAFYRRASGLPVDHRFDEVEALAAAVRAHFSLQFGTGVVVANPVPVDDELPRELYESALARALEDAHPCGVRGRDVTPLLLDRLRELTAGASVTCNRALLLDNARVAAELAAALTPGLNR